MGSKKADKLEAAGDALATKGDHKKALKKYRLAVKENPECVELYNKLIKTHEKTKESWKEKDFVESLSWTMKKQELEEPAIKQIHAKLSPEWKKAVDMAIKLLDTPEDEKFSKMIEEFVALGEIGTRVLIEILRTMRLQ